jgi:flavin-dependent dehydrogenase
LAIYARCALNHLLLDRAEEAGARVVSDRISQLRRAGSGWDLEGRRGVYRADWVVLAAGARTRLRGLLTEEFSARDFMLTFGYFVPVSDDLLRIRFFEDFEGYAWAFPRPDHLSVGICGKVGEDRMPGLRERLHGFMQAFGYSTQGATRYSHLLPSLTVESWSALRLAGQSWALAGDAAGLVDPLTGEGIYYAMRSGELVAEALLQGELAQYPERVREEFGKSLALGARLAPMFYHGEFLGGPNATRLIEFAARSRAFMNLLQDLVEGSECYDRLGARLYSSFFTSLFESTTEFLRQALHRVLAVRRKARGQSANSPHTVAVSHRGGDAQATSRAG